MNNLGINYFKKILEPMLACIENKEYKIVYWSKIQGYGLRASDFENVEDYSRRRFSYWRNLMLKQKMIKIPQVKRRPKKGGVISSSYNCRFAISPLGICYYSKVSNKIGTNFASKIIKVLNYNSEYPLHVDWKEISKIMGEKEAGQILKKVCDSVEIIEINDEVHVMLSYKSRRKIKYEFFKYIINQKQVYLELPEDEYTDQLHAEFIPVSTPKIDDDLFFTDIAEFILEAFCYSIIENCHWKIMNTSRTLGWAKITNKEKLNFENIVSKYEDMLEKIPFEVYQTANDFIGQKIFGSIIGEQRLTKKISDYYYHKIAPKYGLDFVDVDGKPFQLFSPENIKL